MKTRPSSWPVLTLRALRQLVSETKLAYASIAAALCLGLVTYSVLSSPGFLDGQSNIAFLLLTLDGLVLVVLSGFVLRQIVNLIKRRQKRRAGYQLHLRLAMLFSLVAVLPALIVMAFSVFVLDYSLRGWFNQQISTAVQESVIIANSYLEEHKRSVTGQILAMANDINREAHNLANNRRRFDAFINNQAGVRNLAEALVLDSTGRVLANSDFAYAITFSNLDDAFYETARQGEVALDDADADNRIRAGIKLNQFVDAYLLVGRFVDPTVTAAVDRTRVAASAYQLLDIRQLDLQISFAVLFGLVSLLLLLGSVWVGLNFANAIVTPISAIIGVADKVRTGSMNIRVGAVADKGEIGELAASFDKMLDEMTRSRKELVGANVQLDKRREFTEAVLAGVSSGVIGIDKDKRITLPNLAAQSMLNLSPGQVIGQPLAHVVPEFAPLLERIGSGRRNLEHNVRINREGARLDLLVRVASETLGGAVVGYVVTFDNVSDLLDAQRKAAWADVARRIAHEIRNPLTPIQLAAEQLAGKYTPAEKDKRERFARNVETIIRQVEDIRRLVDEFSSFGRMPSPVFGEHDLVGIVESQAALFRAEASNSDIALETHFGEEKKVMLECDDGMVRQVVTNLLRNALEAMNDSETDEKKIRLALAVDRDTVCLQVVDNGPGLPPRGQRESLTDPYVTFRNKGTGLGLAIVKKIMEDHGGHLLLASAGDKDVDMPAGYHGAMIALLFNRRRDGGQDEA